MLTPTEILANLKRAESRRALLSRTNNGQVIDVMAQFREQFCATEDASTQLDRLLTRQEYVGGAE